MEEEGDTGLGGGANEATNPHLTEGYQDAREAEKKLKMTSKDGGGASSRSSEGVTSYVGGQWDGALVLVLVSKAYKPMRELWCVCKGLDAVIPRGVCINLRTPEKLVPRLLQQHKQKVNGEHYFSVVNVRLGWGVTGDEDDDEQDFDDYSLSEEEEEEAPRDRNVASALTVLPPRFETLKFGWYYNVPMDLVHVAVDKVVLGDRFNSKLKLPLAAREVEFGDDFNLEVTLNNGLERLRFGRLYNQPVHLPSGLKVLDFYSGSLYDQPLSLPSSIRELTLGYHFNQPLELTFGVENVTLRGRFDQPLVIPASVQKLDLDDTYNFNNPLTLPDGLKESSLGHAFNQPIRLSACLRRLALGFTFNRPLQLPSGLQVLSFCDVCCYFNQPIILPPSILEAKFGAAFHQRVRFMKGLTVAKLGADHDQPVELPEGQEDRWRMEVDKDGWKCYKRELD